jgi:hypothetical protein
LDWQEIAPFTIEKDIQTIDLAFAKAASKNWLIIESDSEDKTLNKLKELCSDPSKDFISMGALQPKYPKRSERIAICRNRYLDEIKTNPKYYKIDYVVVADLDGINTKLTPEAVLSCWHLDEDWDACFANQSEAYYDVWALRHKLWSPNDCWAQYKFLLSNGKSKHAALNAAVHSRMIKLNKNLNPIKVDSAFGGLGIYKKNTFIQSEYIGITEHGDEICEHVTFHKNLCRNGFKLFIAPKLINCGWNEHNRILRFQYKIISGLKDNIISFLKLFVAERTLRKLIKRFK